jgi:hypothetical protein
MNARLPKDWITAPAIDRELKQYILLGYLQGVKQRFSSRKLFPQLQELSDRLDELAVLARSKEDMTADLSRDLAGFDQRTGRPVFTPMEEDVWLRVIDEVIAFAMPEMRRMIGAGRDLLEELVARVHFEPVGVIPLDAREGYLLLREGREARVYTYRLSLLVAPGETSSRHVLTTNYLTTCTITLAYRYEQIKSELVRQQRHLPNPATFAFESEWELPCTETYLPIAKQLVLEHIRRNAA